MGKPYGLISDIHAHAWSAFASLDSEGRNTRLMDIIHDINRACQTTLDAGGDLLVVGGDIFHLRGSVAPSVFNPVRDCFRDWSRKGLRIEGIPGNHDAEGKNLTRLTSAAAMLEDDGGIFFAHEPMVVERHRLYIPYVGGPKATIQAIESAMKWVGSPGDLDAFVHCGIDGTLTHMPAHGFTAEMLQQYGFRRVFAGDFHHHIQLADNVWSIGAVTHQTFSDISTKAGFCLVYPDRVQFFASHAPNFIEIDGSEDEGELALKVDGHFVRARIGTATAAEVAHWREQLMEMGAKGVVIQAIPADAQSRRAGVSAKSLASLDQSVQDYVKEKGMSEAVAQGCARILQEIRA